MTNEMTVYDDVNIAIQRYVEFNVLDRYQLKEVQLYLRYRRLDIEEVLKFETTWNPNIDSESNRIKKIQTQFSQNKDTVKLIFNQEQDSSNFSFDYYYNLYFEKI
jgi:oligoribonuclease (3'-5' exoribonuclease)